jgi:hypothetical protein
VGVKKKLHPFSSRILQQQPSEKKKKNKKAEKGEKKTPLITKIIDAKVFSPSRTWSAFIHVPPTLQQNK